MALPRPSYDGLTHIRDVAVNGLTYNRYDEVMNRIYAGAAMALSPQPDNPHDANAIAVVFHSKHIGWVPRTQNADLARRFRAGQKLIALVDSHEPGQLRISVWRTDKEEVSEAAPAEAAPAEAVLASSAAPYATIAIEGRPSQAPKNFDRIKGYLPGAVFQLTSSVSRSSVTLVDPRNGETLAWYRKVDVPKPAILTLAQRADAGVLRAVLRADGKFDLWHGSLLPTQEKLNDLYAPKAENLRIPVEVSPGVSLGSAGDILCITNPTTTLLTTEKENTMNNFIARLINVNKKAAGDAAVLEAGRIANNTLIKLIISRLPFLARFTGAKYFEGPVGKLVVANGALALAQQLRPNDPRVRSLTEAMTVQAYQEVYQQVDVEGMIDQLLDLPEIKRALRKLDTDATGDLLRTQANREHLDRSMGQAAVGEAKTRDFPQN